MYPKIKASAKNTFGDLQLPRKRASMTNCFMAMGKACFRLWPMTAILDFKIQFVFLNISFSTILRSFYSKGEVCIMIYQHSFIFS